MRSSILATSLLVLGALAHHNYFKPSPFRIFCRWTLASWEYATEKEHSELFKCPDFVKGEIISLKKLSTDDFPSYYKLLQENKITDMFFLLPDGTIPDIPPWYYMHNLFIGHFFGNRCVYSVIINATNTIHGMIELIRDSKKICGHVSGFADPRVWGKGASSETFKLATNIFFDVTHLEHLEVQCAPHNERCKMLLQKCGLTFSHISKNKESTNELVFKLKRTKN